jgi:GT2 family glycosyltransferase
VSLRLSVVVATYNRGAQLLDLLRDLEKQTLPPAQFEVVVIDDGSKVPAETFVKDFQSTYSLTLRRQVNAGPAAARHHGVQLARGAIVVVTDDDMRLSEDFLQQHLQAHDAGATVVLGLIAPAPNLKRLPVFEKFHAQKLEDFVQGVRAGTEQVRGISVCTGNVSFRREAYLRLGGFDASLARSEDRELGVRLEKDGGKLVFVEGARVVHESDHADATVWLKRACDYGIYDRRIAGKHPDVETADPWRFLFLINPVSRALMAVPLLSPALGGHLSRLVLHSADLTDKLGWQGAAIKGATLSYGLQYFRGVRTDAGSLRQVLRDVQQYLRKRAHAHA